MNNMKEILKARENRYKKRLSLHENYNQPIIVFTLNIPGPVKTSDLIEETFENLVNEIKEILTKNKKEDIIEIIHVSQAGPEAFFILPNNNIKSLKKEMINIEKEHFLGRLMDLDVYRANGEVVSRDSLDKEDRKCLVCDKIARECIIKRRHSIAELKEKINTMLKKYMRMPGRGENNEN